MNFENHKIYSAFFRETKTFYTKESFAKFLGLEDSVKESKQQHAERIYSKLLEQNIIKSCNKKQFKLNELNSDDLKQKEENDPSILNNKEKGFYFNFVGVVFVDDCVLKVYPKYIDLPVDKYFSEADDKTKSSIEKHFSQVLRVIKILSSINQDSSLNQQTQEKYNHIGMQIFLLEDYYRNGIYQNKETIIETNGDGEIDWDKTINETTAIIKSNKPYYVELQTINTRSNEFDYFKMLHESILCQCSQTLRKTGLLSYLGMTPCELSGMPLSFFGDVNYIRYRLQQEIRTQFVTKKRNQLVSLLTYITETTGHKSSESFKLFGTNSFEQIWESVCKSVFDDLYLNKHRLRNSQLNDSPKISELIKNGIIKNIPKDDRDISDGATFKSMIENSRWTIGNYPYTPSGNLTPDIISIDEQENFYILDAKYYIIKINKGEKSIENQPGIQDVLKQFAYEKAYSSFLRDFRFFNTVNAFIVPSLFSKWKEEEKDKNKITFQKGFVTYNLMQNSAYEHLGPIQVLEIVPEFILGKFLKSEVCTGALTKVLEEKNLLNHINRFINSDGFDKGLTLAGFMRKNYVDQIKDGMNIYFFFYVHDSFRELQIHPEILRCNKFIGYEQDNKQQRKIVGDLIPEIKKVNVSELSKMIKESGISDYQNTHENYYCMKVQNVKVEEMSDTEFSEMINKIENAPGNYILSEHSPKVF